jgi:hypothetical protein
LRAGRAKSPYLEEAPFDADGERPEGFSVSPGRHFWTLNLTKSGRRHVTMGIAIHVQRLARVLFGYIFTPRFGGLGDKGTDNCGQAEQPS